MGQRKGSVRVSSRQIAARIIRSKFRNMSPQAPLTAGRVRFSKTRANERLSHRYRSVAYFASKNLTYCILRSYWLLSGR